MPENVKPVILRVVTELLNLEKVKNVVGVQNLAEQGEVQAQFNLGSMYSEGQGVTVNI